MCARCGPPVAGESMHKKEELSMATFGILVGGGPAPGINGVISAATILAHRNGARVLGFFDGFARLMQAGEPATLELQVEDVARISQRGGSILRTSRANPTRDPAALERVVKNLLAQGVERLITIGGDDTAYSARRVAEAAKGRIAVAHVPKTIDNDLPLPQGIPTFGFETARENAAHILENLLEDARTTGRWYLTVVMGRSAGHLALGAGKAAGATLTLIPEEFPEGPIPLERVVRTLEGAIVKRLVQGQPHGVAVVAEGIGIRLDPTDLEFLGDVERDEHGHIRLSEVPLGRLLRDRVREGLAERGVKLTMVPKDVGYELRCAAPNAFDLDYTRDLGAGAVRTLLAGRSGVMVTRQGATSVPIPFEEIVDPATGKTRVRVVDTRTDSYASASSLQVRIEAGDLEDEQKTAEIGGILGLSGEEVRLRYAGVC